MSWFLTHARDIVEVAGAAVGVASLVTGLTPGTRDDAMVSRLRRVVERVSVVTHRDHDGTFKIPGRKGGGKEPVT